VHLQAPWPGDTWARTLAAMLLWPVIALAMAAPACCNEGSRIYAVAALKLRLVLGKRRQELEC
jgi:hypothetical protein